MNANQKALVERLDGFLAKIDERLEAIIEEATAGCAQLAAQYPDDPLPLTNALSGLDHRVSQLRDRIEQTWDGQIEPMFEEAGDSAFHDVGLDRKQDAEEAFDHRWEVAKVKIHADHARNLFTRAQAALQVQPVCDRCGGPIHPADRTVSETVVCSACNATNQYQPAAAIQQYGGGGVEALAAEATVGMRYEITRFRTEVDRWRRARNWAEEPLESLEKWRAMELAYYTRVAEEKSRLLGKPVDQAFIDGRMGFFDKYELHMNQTWVRAHGKG